MTTFKFYWQWFKLGRAYWKSRHVWTLMAYINQASTPPAPSLDDELAAWIAAAEEDEGEA